MASSDSRWIWSEVNQNYYYVTYDADGTRQHHWAEQPALQSVFGQSSQSGGSQYSSQGAQSSAYGSIPGQPSPPFPRYSQADSLAIAAQHAPVLYHNHSTGDPEGKGIAGTNSPPGHLIQGTSPGGWNESLDSSYRIRTGHEARDFFVIGRVFSMLYSEAALETAQSGSADNDAFTVVKFG
ncbi:hypothetical protein BKA66DRAFT_577117 [Pyrenochaeta sp. MPI-SDFR-AT-0127]|nr:hypothetical protein BKA66DRAFT_577117 [Pyrenochaeta sp. MPI-SDFR-AT-0127]